jgi:hypothetical protein
MNYHIEPAEYPGSEIDNPYALPAKSSAERLLRLFMDSVQPSLPVIRQDLFTEQFHSFYSGMSKHPGRKWLALLNLVFAISNKLCQLCGQEFQDKEHRFFSRAQTLNISESLVEDHEDLQQVQIETLAAFYLLISSHINRCVAHINFPDHQEWPSDSPQGVEDDWHSDSLQHLLGSASPSHAQQIECFSSRSST